MTLDELTQYVVLGDRDGLCRAMASLTEPQRDALSRGTLKLFSTIDEFDFPHEDRIDRAKQTGDAQVVEVVEAIVAQTYADWRIPRLTAGLAVVGLCGEKVLES